MSPPSRRSSSFRYGVTLSLGRSGPSLLNALSRIFLTASPVPCRSGIWSHPGGMTRGYPAVRPPAIWGRDWSGTAELAAGDNGGGARDIVDVGDGAPQPSQGSAGGPQRQ